MAKSKKEEAFKKRLIAQFTELAEILNPVETSEHLNIVINATINLVNKSAPELTPMIEGLKPVQKFDPPHPGEPVLVFVRRKETHDYLSKIVDYLATHDLLEYPTELKKESFKISEGWKIFWASTIVALIIYLLSLLW